MAAKVSVGGEKRPVPSSQQHSARVHPDAYTQRALAHARTLTSNMASATSSQKQLADWAKPIVMVDPACGRRLMTIGRNGPVPHAMDGSPGGEG